MSSWKNSLFAALASAALTLGCLYYFDRSRVEESDRLRRENETLRIQASQRVRVVVPPVLPKAAVAPPKEREKNSAAIPPAAPRPFENYRNEGRATPLAALQTFAWACDRGDAPTVEALLYFDGAAREKFASFMAAMLPEVARAQGKSTEAMAAILLTRAIMERPYPSADILEVALTERSGEDRVIFKLPGAGKDRTAFQKTADGWSYVITEAMVDAYVAQSKAPR